MTTTEHLKRSLSTDYFTEKGLTPLIGCQQDLWLETIVKELIDNALDAAEQKGLPVVSIGVASDGTLTIYDNGPGMPAHVVTGSLNYDSFISDKHGRVQPTRGALGNALKCTFAVPAVLNGASHVEISSMGINHDINLTFDDLTGEPQITRVETVSKVYFGCFLKIHGLFRSRFESSDKIEKAPNYTIDRLFKIVQGFSLINPHAEFQLHILEYEFIFKNTANLDKWQSGSLVPSWFDAAQLKSLLQLEYNNSGNISINEFIGQFRGLTQSRIKKSICETIGMKSQTGIESLLTTGTAVPRILELMQENSTPPKPITLGGIDPDHVVKAWKDIESKTEYRRAMGYTEAGRPFIIDIFIQEKTPKLWRDLTIGLNHSFVIRGDIDDLEDIFDDMNLDYNDPVRILIHINTPHLDFHTKGKNAISLDSSTFEVLRKKLLSAGADWTKKKRKLLKGIKTPAEKPVTLPLVSVLPKPSDHIGMLKFAETLKDIQKRIDFKSGSRGWCYLLEDAIKLNKSDFKKAEERIGQCRKTGLLPWDFTAEDSSRELRCGDHVIETLNPEEFLTSLITQMKLQYLNYHPINLHDFLDTAIVVAVEKVDLIGLFEPICKEFHVPLFNCKGWSDINSRCKLLIYMKEMQEQGKACRVLYCGDHDPGGLNISTGMTKNLKDLEKAVGFSSEFLTFERFGLNYDFIIENGLTWLENLDTTSPGTPSLDDPKHPDHNKAYVQGYIEAYGVRKCEANALVVKHEAGRQLLRATLSKYIKPEQISEYLQAIAIEQGKVEALLKERFAA